MVFTGTYEHAIDAKRRLAIPSEVRRTVQRALGLGEGDSAVFYCVLGGPDMLCLYTEPGYHRLFEKLQEAQQDRDPAELLGFEDLFFSQSHRIEMDSAGRVRLPELLLEHTGLSGDVAITGAGDHLKVRDKIAWRAELDKVLTDKPGAFVNPRMYFGRRQDGKAQ